MEEQKLDYPRMYERLDGIIDSVMDEISNWCDLNNQRWRTGCKLLDYPPRIHLSIELDGADAKRAKEFLPQYFNSIRLTQYNVGLDNIRDLVKNLTGKFSLTGMMQRHEHILTISFRHKAPSYILEDANELQKSNN